MQSHQRIALISLLSLLISAAALAQTIPGYTLQESVLIPVTGAVVNSETSLVQGVHYKLRALGSTSVFVPTFFFGSFSEGDAEYGFGSTGFPFFDGNSDTCFLPNGFDVGLAINDTDLTNQKTPFWGDFNSSHTYTVDFTGLGGPIAINYHDCEFSGNQGVLTVQIFRPMGMTLSTTTPPTFTDVSPGTDTFGWSSGHSVSGRAISLAAAPDAKRLYAGTFAGVWRSDDGATTWRQMTRPQPPSGPNAVPGALLSPDVYDIAISPTNRDVVLAGTSTNTHATNVDGVFRSEDGGVTWQLVKNFNCPGGNEVSQIVFAPDDSNLVFATGGCAIGISHDGGKTWTQKPMPKANSVWHIAVAPYEPPLVEARAVTGIGLPPLGVRRVYAIGSNQMFYSVDGGNNWIPDSGINSLVNLVGVGGGAARNGGNASRVLLVEPGNNAHVLLAVKALANGPSYYVMHQCGLDGSVPEVDDGTICNTTDARKCGEGSVWLGDFSGFDVSDPNKHSATWTQLPGPPVYFGGSTPSGNVYLNIQKTANSYLLFFSDLSHVHVSAGLPTAGGWHRMEGLDASQTAPPRPPNTYCNHLFVHADPHALVFTPNYSLSLQPTNAPAPFNQNKVAAPSSTGDLWMANDGGIDHARGAVPAFQRSSGLSTLATINITGLAVKGFAPALYFGTGDNDDFYSLDGGASWRDPLGACGDCDAWFADPAQTNQVMEFVPRRSGGGFGVFTNTAKYPDVQRIPQDNTQFVQWVCPADCNAVSSYYDRGYRPLVLTGAGKDSALPADLVVIGTKASGARAVFRKTNSQAMTSATDWEDTSKAAQYGPDLPACDSGFPSDCLDVVQASGGHNSPVLYVGDPGDGPNTSRSHTLALWKWAPGMASWQQIVPSPSQTSFGNAASQAIRFFIDPFNPNTIYLIDNNAIKRSDDGGATWAVDTNLDNAVTENQQFAYTGDFAVIKDMVFARGEKATRFAVGNAGVFYTLNGANWFRLLSTTALPSHPVSAYFDPISDPCDRALYVGLDGRGILRVDPIPSPGRFGTGGERPCQDIVLTE